MNNRDTRLRQLQEERDRLAKSLGKLKRILRGSIMRHGNICGKAVCRCKRKKNPVLHGPYSYLSHRSKKGIKEYDEAIDVIYRKAEINYTILRYHYDKL